MQVGRFQVVGTTRAAGREHQATYPLIPRVGQGMFFPGQGPQKALLERIKVEMGIAGSSSSEPLPQGGQRPGF